jgi:RNA polymerase sigma factor (sigma-70 family)
MSAQQLNYLYEMARSGNPDSERGLFECLSARFRLFARHRIWNETEADEVVQEALVTICREYKSLEVSHSFSAWAYKVLDNRLLNYLEAKRRRQNRTADEDSELDSIPGQTADFELRRQLLDCLKKIAAVNRRYSRALNLHAQGYGTDDICRRIDIGENTFYSMLHRGRALLQRCLDTGEIK